MMLFSPLQPASLLFVLLVVSAPHPLSDGQQLLTSPKHCDFDCVHGKCNRQTRECVCSAEWTGADCDLCPVGLRCSLEVPSLSLILPQASPRTSPNDDGAPLAFVSAFGTAFPKGVSAGYDCLFGTLLTKGHWVSRSLVRCPVPAQSLPGKYAFSIAPEGSPRTQIVNEGTPHFTFFLPCSSTQCRGFCLGPLCLCPHAQFGIFCQLATPLDDHSVTVKWTLKNNTEMKRASEFQPYFVEIPNWHQLNRLEVQSDIAGLELNPLDGTLCWPSPLGRVRSYSIGLSAKTIDGTNFMANRTLKVKPSYSAQLDKAEPIAANSNGRLITGRVIWKEPKAALNQSVPLLLRVLQGDKFVEEIAGNFQLYGGGRVKLSGQRIAVHPAFSEEAAQSVDETEAVEWSQLWPNVTEFDTEAKVGEGHAFEFRYSLQMGPTGGRCSGQWHFEVVEPRGLIGIENATFERNDTTVRLRFGPVATFVRPLTLKMAFICMPTGQSQMIRQTLVGIGTAGQRGEHHEGTGGREGDRFDLLEMDPKRLFVDIASPRPSSIFTLDLSVPADRADLLQRSHLESASFSPFLLVWLSRPSPNSWRLWLSLHSDQWDKEGNSDGALLIRGGEKLALSVPYRIQRSSPARSDVFQFTLTVNDPTSITSPSLSSGQFSSPPMAEVELFCPWNGQQFARSVPLNVPVQFGPLRATVCQLRIRSRNFRPFSSIVKIDPLSNALVVQPWRMPNQYLAFDGQTFALAWEKLDDALLRPRVRLIPSEVFDANSTQFVDIAYTDGPPNSFVWLSSQLLPNQTLCLGCAFRQRLSLRSFPSVPAHCAALSVALPFSIALSSGGSFHFRQFLLITGTTKGEKDTSEGEEKKICHWEEEKGRHEGRGREEMPPNVLPQFALRSPIFRSCAHAKLRRCRSLVRLPGPKCAHWWAQLTDDLLTVHTIAQFLLLSVDCHREGANLERMEKMIKCIASVDKECPVHPLEAEMAPHRGGQLFNQMGHLRPFRVGLQSLFPALSLIETQLVNFPTLFGEFLSHLKLVLPSALLLPLSSPAIFDQFVAAIADNSSQGPKIEDKEINGMARQLTVKWNRVVSLASGEEDEELAEEEEEERRTELAKWRALVASADRLKSVVRQFGAENPFSLLTDVLRQIFTNANTNGEAENCRVEETIGWADVRTDQGEVGENDQFRLLVIVRIHELSPVVLSSLDISLRFSPVTAPLKFRLGPILNFGHPSELRGGDSFRTEWTVLPVAESRLTEPIQLESILTLSFELDGQRMAQRLRAPSVLVRPRPVLRLLAFSVPSLTSSSPVHSLHISAINSGYSDLNSVQFRELCPDIKWADNGTPVDFRLSNVHVEGNDGRIVPEGSSLSFGQNIASGNASHMTLNFTVTTQQQQQQQKTSRVALFHNFSAIVSVNGSLLPPAQFEQRFFFVLQPIRPRSLLIVSEHSSPLPLYLYSKANSRLTPLVTLQLVEEKEVPSEINGHRFLSRVFALRRLALFPSPVGSGVASAPFRFPPSGSSPFSSPAHFASSLPIASVFATLRVNTSQTFVDGVKLLRVSELSQNKRRHIDPQLVWIGEDSDEKMTTIHFVDLDASAAVPQLFYELLFGRPEHFRAPFFARPLYTFRLNVPSSIGMAGQQVLARITATSAQGLALNYSLLSPQSECPFSIVSATGDIVVSPHLLNTPTEYCLNVVATDQKGLHTRVPVQILLGEEGQSPNGERGQKECGIYTAETTLFEHKYKKAEPKTTNGIAATNNGREEMINKTTTEITENGAHNQLTVEESVASSTSTRPIVFETGGDSTLSPVIFPSAAEVEVSAEAWDNQSTATPRVATPAVSPTLPTQFSSGVSPTLGHPSQIHSHQQFLMPHRTMFSTTKAPFSMQLAGVGTGKTMTSEIAKGTRKNGTERIRAGAASTQREEDRAAETGGQSNAQTMAEMACRLRSTKPIWALICDMAKTVYRTTILNTK